MDAPVRHEGAYVFESFRLDPISRTLTRDGVRIKLRARLFDTLLCLVANHGRVVERDELLQTVWPTRTVEAGSVGSAISSLREVLNAHGAPDTMIVTAPGRGYRFGARVAFEALDLTPDIPAIDTDGPYRGGRRVRRGVLVACLVGLFAAAAGVVRWRAPQANAPAMRGQATIAGAPLHSLAVLPFTEPAAAPGQADLGDGLAEQLINALGGNGAFRVAARMSSFSFKGTRTAIPEIARQLRVAHVLEGSVRRDGTRLRVDVQLVDGVTGYQIWAHSYDRDQGDIFTLEGQIAEAVLGSLKVVVLGDQARRLGLGGTTDARAFDAYLSGTADLSENDHEADRRAIDAFGVAISRDPAYALAYAKRARALTYLASDGGLHDGPATQRMFAAARRDAETAISLAPDLGEAHMALAFTLKCTLSDFGLVAAEYDRALALAPDDATILMGYARLQVDLGHAALGVRAAEHAADLDPLTPSTYRTLARVLAYAGRTQDALLALERARRLKPADPREDRIARSFVDRLQGNARDALETCGGVLDFRDESCLAWAYHRLGRQKEAEAYLARLQASQGEDGAFMWAVIYADWGRTDEALHWLEVAYRVRDPGLMDMRVSPTLAPLRNTDVFRDIERRIGFPP